MEPTIPEKPRYAPREERPWLTPSEREPGFYEIQYIDLDVPHLGQWTREISWQEASSLEEALKLTETQHKRALSFSKEPHEIRVKKISKYWLKREDNERVLDILWEKRPEEYLDLWEPGISTSEMIRKLKEGDPSEYEGLAQYVVTEYSRKV